jgi:hypothetical protein
MIWWRGFGALVPLLSIVLGVLTMQLPQGGVRSVFGTLMFGALGYLFFRLGRKANDAGAIEERLGEAHEYKPAYAQVVDRLRATHSFMSIPLQYWAYVVWMVTAALAIDELKALLN